MAPVDARKTGGNISAGLITAGRRGEQVSDEAAAEKYPDAWTTVKPYLRVVPQPK